jgi:hypothetical protein
MALQTTAIARQMVATGKYTTIEKRLKVVFSVRSVSTLYDEEHLRLRENLETAQKSRSQMRQSPAGKNVSMQAEETVGIRHQATAGKDIDD